MVPDMRANDRITLHTILKYKEHFDQKLIDINEYLDIKVTTLTSYNAKLIGSNQSIKKQNSDLRLKVKDLTNQKYTNNKKYLEAKKENDDLLEYLKKIQKEIDELKKENEKQRKEIKQQEKDINKQKTIIDRMKHMNSVNSNLPPSMDILGRTKAKAQANTRVKTGRSRGGQEHHPLHKSKLGKTPNHIITLKVKKAPTGAVPIKDVEGNIEYYATQEIDIVFKSVVTETRYYIEHEGEELDKELLNTYAINPLVYSGDFKATVVYLNQKGTIPLQRLCDMMKEISKDTIQLHPSTIINWCKECHSKSGNARHEIRKELLNNPVVHVDETSVKLNKKQYWIHALTNEKGAFFVFSQKRGDDTIGPVKLLEDYTGILVHDHFSVYQKLLLCQHAECNAHIDRYLKSGIEFDKSKECQEMLDLLHEILHRKTELIAGGNETMPANEISNYEERYTKILKKGIKNYNEQHPAIKKKYEAEYVKTFKRMLIYKEDHLRFMKNFIVPYTNNNAEKQCRAVKARKNISGQFVSESSGEAYASILSLLQTAKIKNENALETLISVFH